MNEGKCRATVADGDLLQIQIDALSRSGAAVPPRQNRPTKEGSISQGGMSVDSNG